MRYHNLCLISIAMLIALAGSVFGKITPDETKLLGTKLTRTGAEKAGNVDGTIPEYDGGNTAPPANFKPGSGYRPDPYADEKPLFSIDSKNMARYEDKLTEGVKALMQKYPTFRIDVYRTHRSVAYPEYILKNTKVVSQVAELGNGGLSLQNAHAAIPFPIPKSGIEVMWNHQTRYHGYSTENTLEAYVTNSAGKSVLVNRGWNIMEVPYWDESDKSGIYWRIKTRVKAPSRRAGEQILVLDPLNLFEQDRRAWQYLPGQRRTRLAPDIAYDTPDTALTGLQTYDDLFIYNGKMDRYDFKLVGKKEIYVPYNAYRSVYGTPGKDLLGPKHLDPDKVRWELHRVWVVEAMLKPGKRHLYSRRTFYIDEDSWTALASDQYDGSGKMYRVGLAYMAPSYDVPAPNALMQTHYDLVANCYNLNFFTTDSYGFIITNDKMDDYEWTADSLAAGGVR